MAVNVNDRSIKECIAQIVSTIYCMVNKASFDDVYRILKFDMRTDKGVRTAVSIGRKCAARVKDKEIKDYVDFLVFLEQLYFANRKRG